MKHHRILLGITVTLLGTLAWAVTPGVWRQSSEGDFAKCERTNTVVDSHGDVTLARRIDILMSTDDAPPVISAVAFMDGAIYAASGVDGAIYRIADGECSSYAKLPSTIVTCLAPGDDVLLAGGGGEKAGLYALQPDGTVKKRFTDPSVKYIWTIVPGENESLYLATGPEAKVWRLSATDQAEVIFQAEATLAKNILCLAKTKDGKLLAGTDEKGLVFEIDPKAKTSRVVLDAGEKEISTILPDGAGGFYAATSDAAKASASKGKANGTKNGRAGTSETKPAESVPPVAPTTQPAEPAEPTTPETTPPAKSLLTRTPDEPTAPVAQDVHAQAAREDDGSVTITLPAGRKLPVLVQKGRRVVMIEDLTTGRVQAIPAEKVRVEHIPASLASQPPSATKPNGTPSSKARHITPPATGASGNAVYHVDAAGMRRTLFRRPATIQAMVRQGNRLILATGNEGRIYFVTLDGALSGEVIDTDAKQVTALTEGREGTLIFATSNVGSVGRIGRAYAPRGTLIRPPLDAKQIAQWGTLKLRGRAPEGTTLTVATRSGNLTPAQDATWSSWSKETPLQDGFVPMGAPAARFLQYRVTMTSTGRATPTLGAVQSIYQVANLAPAVSGVRVQATNLGKTPMKKEPTKVYRLVTIQASDPNHDTLQYKVQFRKAGTKVWVEVAKDLKKPKYRWDTRTVSDGEYELRVIADDSPSNPTASALTGERISEPFVVDNTPPRFDKLTVVVRGNAAVLHGSVTDALSRITSLQYSVDSATKWRTFLPADGICDSTHETFRAEVADLAPGAHQITVRALDVFGNIGYIGQAVTVRK